VVEAHPVKLAEDLLSKLFAAAAWDFCFKVAKAELFFLKTHFLFPSTPSTLGKSSSGASATRCGNWFECNCIGPICPELDL
jgi:hypothetical protein